MSYILQLEPIRKTLIWGSESWVISAHQNGDAIIQSSPFHGMTLGQLWEGHRNLFGNLPGKCFPLLIKEIDAVDDLSIQVHPDDAYADQFENHALGKYECWYILDCKKDAGLVIGVNAKDRAEAEQMIQDSRWDELLRTVPIKPGDFFQIDAGCVHAIKGGVSILEIQQNSDITYRLYDYDRLSNGAPRELHIKKSLDVIRYDLPTPQATPQPVSQSGCIMTQLIANNYYHVTKCELHDQATFVQDTPFLCVSVVCGKGIVEGIPMEAGKHLLLTAGYGKFKACGNLVLILTSPA